VAQDAELNRTRKCTQYREKNEFCFISFGSG